MASLRQIAGTFVYDWPRFLLCVFSKNRYSWCKMRNRNDRILIKAEGVKCDWEYTRSLHLCNVFPFTGSLLLKKAFKENPIALSPEPLFVSTQLCCSNLDHNPGKPQVSYIIGHRGKDRLSHLLLILQSIAAQSDISFECIVVEQDHESLIKESLPKWVRYVFTPPLTQDMAYSRSWAFNVAAHKAMGDTLILHDNDMLVPVYYAKEIHDRIVDGYEVVQPKRFIFYFDQKSTQRSLRGLFLSEKKFQIDSILENLEGGGSLGISRKAYFFLGGMDEDFVGWGGEDNEFWDRCLTLKVWEYANLPLIHLWHEPQSGKRAINGNGALTAALTVERRAIPAEYRIEELRKRDWGCVNFKGIK